MLDGEKSSDDERQKKVAMLKYTYEQVLSDQAEQINTKRNNTNNLTAILVKKEPTRIVFKRFL